MAFKLGREKRDFKIPGKTKIFRKKLDGDTLAEANMDGTMNIDPSIDLSSKFGKRVIKHEQQHLDDIESGRAGYNDNVVMWEDKLYMRRKIDGEDVIDGPNGRWPEGHKNHPWEQSAIQAEKE
tara:strand:- start:20 stop:388 length:369 start_codon:yes stop_codon:yes gene_type:complete